MYLVGPFRGSIVSSSVSDFFAKVFKNHDFFGNLNIFIVFSVKIINFGTISSFFVKKKTQVFTFCRALISKMRPELKNLFLSVFSNVFGSPIPRVDCFQLGLRFFAKVFKNHCFCGNPDIFHDISFRNVNWDGLGSSVGVSRMVPGTRWS